MKVLRHPYIDQDIELGDGVIYNLVIQHPQYLRRFLYALEDQLCNGDDFFLFSEKEKEKPLYKEAMLIWNPLKIEVDDKKLDTMIQKDVATHVTQSQKESYQVLIQNIDSYIRSISFDYSLPLAFQDEMPLQNFLKAMTLTTAEEPEGFLPRMLYQIKKIAFGFGIDIFFLLNLHDYLIKDEMNIFMTEMKRMELFPVLLSSHIPSYKTDEEFVILIDQDLCELHIASETAKN